jgi:hypothetical protein
MMRTVMPLHDKLLTSSTVFAVDGICTSIVAVAGTVYL